MNLLQQSLPNLLIPGYHKAGTTTLFHELSKHPDIFPSPVKEPFYFRPFINGREMPPIADYTRHFKGATSEIYRMEGSPTYIYGGAKAAKIIADTLGEVKIIISLRNPVDQLFSLYKHHLRFMKIDADQTFFAFVQEKEDFSRQFYDIHLKEWYEVFGDNIKCIFFQNLIADPEQVITEIIAWLGLKPIDFIAEEINNTNPGGTYKYKRMHKLALGQFERIKPLLPHQFFVWLRKQYFALNGQKVSHQISSEARVFLAQIFAPHNLALKDLLLSKGYENLPTWLDNQVHSS